MNITRCANQSDSLVHLRRQWRRWQWHRRRRRWRGEVAATRPPSAKAHEPCDAEVGTQGASVPIATRAAEVYLICLFLCTSLYCEFIAFLSYPARTRPLQQTCHSSSMAQQRNCKEPGSWIVSGWSLIGGEHPATTITWLKSTRL